MNNQVNRESQSFEAMNMKKLVTTAALLVAMATVAAPSAQALTLAEKKAAKKAVLSVPAPEMPAKAAELVGSADKKDRTAMAVAVVEAVIFKNRAIAPLVVSAVIKAAPEAASEVTLAATRIDGAQAAAIVKAATAAAPEQSTAIRQAVTEATRVRAVRTQAVEPDPTGDVNTFSTPINSQTGGNGAGSFEGAAVNPASEATEIDYTDPRDFD